MSSFVDKEQFLSRVECFVKSQTLMLKYEKILKTYDCFSSKQPIQFPSKQHFKTKKSSITTNNYMHPKNPRKTLQTLWNTLNSSNYTKIFHKLKFQIRNENLSSVIVDILKSAVLHNSYRKQFIMMISDLMCIWDKEVISDTVVKWINDYISNKCYIFKHDEEKPYTTYDIFCLKQKHKTNTLAFNNLMIDILDMIPSLNIDVNLYLNDILHNGLMTYIQDDYYVDLFLQAFVQFLDRHVDLMQKFKGDIKKIFDSQQGVSLRNKFTLEKLI